MNQIVECSNCHRRERWAFNEGKATPVDVLAEGGGRLPSMAPQKMRALTALDAFEGKKGPVVGVCEVCGQLMCLEHAGGDIPSMPMSFPSEHGELSVGQTLRGPKGDMTPDEAREWLEEAFPSPKPPGAVKKSMSAFFFLMLMGPFVVWIFAIVFVVNFFLTLAQGQNPAVQGLPGFDGGPL